MCPVSFNYPRLGLLGLFLILRVRSRKSASVSFVAEWTIWVIEFKNSSGLFIRTYKAVTKSMWGSEVQASQPNFA